MTHDALPAQEYPQLSRLERELSAVGNAVYAATRYLEDLDPIGGHHARQRRARIAQRAVYDSWPDQQERAALSPHDPVKDQYYALTD